MFKRLLNLFKTRSRHDMLTEYVASKYPTSVAEVEYWIKAFERSSGGRYGY